MVSSEDKLRNEIQKSKDQEIKMEKELRSRASGEEVENLIITKLSYLFTFIAIGQRKPKEINSKARDRWRP